MKKAVFQWSGGKDSSLALYKVLRESTYDVALLLTTLSQEYDRISMHGVRKVLLEAQVERLGFPLDTLYLPTDVSMEGYDALMHQKLTDLKEQKFTHAIYGDIFLEDLRNYREEQLAKAGLSGVYPIWKQDSKALVEEFIALGFKAIVVCANARLLDASFVGRIIDHAFLNDLPDTVDPAGERGEFHSFVFDGPIFQAPVPVTPGEKVLREYAASSSEDDSQWDRKYWYADLLLSPE